MFLYISKARHRTVTHKESSKKVYEVFSPETLEQIDTFGDDSAIRIGPWWVESSGDGSNKEYILSLDEYQDLEEALTYHNLRINQKMLARTDFAREYLMIMPGDTIVWGDIRETERGGDYQEWRYTFPTTEQLTSMLAERN